MDIMICVFLFLLGVLFGSVIIPSRTGRKRLIFVDVDAIKKETIPDGFTVIAVHCLQNKSVSDCVLEF